MSTRTTPSNSATAESTPPGFRAVTWLVGAYAALSLLTMVAIVVLTDLAPHLVSPQAWVRGIIIAATSILTFAFARRAAKGSPRALLRLRIVVGILLVAVVAVLFFLPLPLWMVIEQAVCGVLLLATALIIFRRPPSGATRKN
ncbi:hypothetical protein G3T36_15645 [Diaminobutyricibacter tongyongensis]|uniref:Uncharacterized protein n=1 Tax=Leifsonia tongyongensis TaxID=1268043 RepID=A0A6L9Y199_9MICO|nr:hypothetical protein [Diaminobutyricibacter tongyongensis]NEN07295.1 hypothetical protein [Diaminobutyricibacter tongyongensis]